MRKSNGIKGLILILSAMFVLGPSLYAFQGGGEGPGGKKRGGGFHEKQEKMMQKMFDELGLTQEQQQRLSEQRDMAEAQRKAVFDQMDQKRNALREELQKPEVDRGQIDRLVNEMAAVESEKLKQHVDGILAIRSILTPEQFAELHKKMETKRGEFEKRRAKWHHKDRFHGKKSESANGAATGAL